MPTPFDLLYDPVPLCILGSYVFLILMEELFPAQILFPGQGSHLRTIISILVFFYLSSYLPIFISPILAPHRIIDGSRLGMFAGVMLGVFVSNLFVYAWHWFIQKDEILMRSMHNMNECAKQIDSLRALFLHPCEAIGLSGLVSFCFSILIGFSAETTTVIILVSNFLNIFKHANIRTPHWLGYIIQRPESLRYYNAQELNKNNYSSIPLIDMVFGTFSNPKEESNSSDIYPVPSPGLGEIFSLKETSEPSPC